MVTAQERLLGTPSTKGELWLYIWRAARQRVRCHILCGTVSKHYVIAGGWLKTVWVVDYDLMVTRALLALYPRIAFLQPIHDPRTSGLFRTMGGPPSIRLLTLRARV